MNEFETARAEAQAAIDAGEPRENFRFSSQGKPLWRKSPERIAWERQQAGGRELKAKLLWGLVRWVLIVAACVIIVRSLV